MKVRGKTVWSRNPALVVRDAEMVLLYRDGKTLHEIGLKYGITRERVRQRLASLGLTAGDGGAAIRGLVKARDRSAIDNKKAEKRERLNLFRWGMSEQEMNAITEISGFGRSDARHPVRLFCRQRQSAKTRGIAWEMTFAQWWRVWQESGKWAERGRGKGYCMARWADDGPYSVENVYICTIGQNFSDSYITKPAAMRFEKACITRARNKLSSPAVTPSAASPS